MSFSLKALLRPHISSLKPYSSARDEYSGAEGIFLDANENPFGSTASGNFNRYPDPYQKEIKAKLAKVKKVNPDQIFLGNGSDEAIDLLLRAFCNPGKDNIIILPPTYGMYEVSAAINDVAVKRVNLSQDYHLRPDQILEAVDEHTKVIFICSPNNPTGNLMDKKSLYRILEGFNGIVVVDEAYIDFAPEVSMTGDLGKYPNLVVIQTFSKAWGLAALRIGMGFASEEIIGILNLIKPPYNISGLTQSKVLEALDQPNAVHGMAGVHNTSVQMSGSSDRVGYNASFGYQNEEGFIPNNNLERFNFGMGINAAVTDKLSVNSSFTYAITDVASPPVNAAFGSGPSGGIPSVFAHVLYTPRTVDLAGMPYENPIDRSSVYYRAGNDIVNPRWVAEHYANTSRVNRFFNSTSLNYDITDDFALTYRLGLDTYTENQEVRLNRGGPSANAVIQNGYFRSVDIRNTIWNQDLILNFNRELSERFGFSALLGGNYRYDIYEQNGIASNNQLTFDLFRHTNFENSASRDAFSNLPLNFTEEQIRMGIYSQITLDFDNYLFLNLSARNDWTSTVKPENRRIFYPGASLSFLPTDAFDWTSATLNSLKFRIGYGTSAGFPDPYRTRTVIAQNTRGFEQGGNIFPTQNLGTILGNPDLRPELHEEVEFGVESSMFNDRLRFDLSLYQKNTRDLITLAPIDPSTGFSSTALNIGRMRNRGVEFQATAVPVQTAAFNWESIVNFGLYRPVVTELGGGLEEIVVAGFPDLGNFAIPGRPFNVIKGTGFIRDEQTGQPVVLPTGDYATASELVELGDPNPAWNGSWINTFRYRGFSLNVMMEYRHGGVIMSNTVTATLARGVTKNPVVDRELTFILPGVKQDGSPNDIQVTASNYFFNNYHTGPDESNVFDGSTLRLRELSLGYDVPPGLLERTPFKRATVALSGTNLWFRALNFPPNMNFDTDVLGLGVGNGLGFDFVTGPSSRRFGGTVTLTF